MQKYVEKMGGRITYVRMRSQKVLSKSRRAFAIERESSIPALQGSRGDFVFSEKGVGIYPVAIFGPSLELVFEAMHKSTAGFYIEATPALSERGFEICGRVTNLNEMPQLEIHDADRQIIKDIHRVARGAIPLVGPHGSAAQHILKAVKDVLNAPLTIQNALEKVSEVDKAFESKGKKAGVGVIVHMMAGTGFVSTGKKSASLPELVSLLDTKRIDYKRRVNELISQMGL
ncbi:MAG TPA: hypothetical protein VM689_14210 [Aliidongia sp.]|nr:hypothetical protein [Aliidongia sp.]